MSLLYYVKRKKTWPYLGNGSQVLLELGARHSNTRVSDDERFGGLVSNNGNIEVGARAQSLLLLQDEVSNLVKGIRGILRHSTER